MICRIQAGNQARIGLEFVQDFLRDAALLDFAIWLRRHLPALVRGRNPRAARAVEKSIRHESRTISSS